MRSFSLAAFMTTALFAAGCFGHVGYTATVSSEGYAPELVYAAPGVQVIADFDDSIFFADSFYWRFDGGGWYRSPRYNGGWVLAAPPPPLQRIDRPRGYVHYRPEGWVSRRERAPQQALPRDGRDDRRRYEGRPPPRAPMVQQPPPRYQQPPPGYQQPPPGYQQRPRGPQQPAPRAAPPPFRGGQAPGGGREHGGDRDDHGR